MHQPAAYIAAAAALVAIPACAAGQQPQQVALPSFSFVQLRGDADVSFKPGSAQRVTILSGDQATSHLSVDGERRLIVDACGQHCPVSYHLRLQIESPEVLPIAVEGPARVSVASGFPAQEKLFLAVTGPGHVDSRAVNAADVFATANQGGSLDVRATSNLFGVAESGGEIRYWGDPRLMTKGVSGSVKKAGS